MAENPFVLQLQGTTPLPSAGSLKLEPCFVMTNQSMDVASNPPVDIEFKTRTACCQMQLPEWMVLYAPRTGQESSPPV